MEATRPLPLLASALPKLSLPRGSFRRTRSRSVFPFDAPSLRYYYHARNGIYWLARFWNLRDQEILFPAYCHGVEVEALHAAGVRLRFYPVHSDLSVDVEEIRSLISPLTRAVYLTHYAGFPGPVEALAELCRERRLRLIEDCALALLSRLGERPLGTFGDASIFCIYKSLPVPHGGALWLRDLDSGTPAEGKPPSLTSTMAYTAAALGRSLRFDRPRRIHGLVKKIGNVAKSASGRLGVVPVNSEHFKPDEAELAMSRFCHFILSRQDFRAIVDARRRNYLYLRERLRGLSPPCLPELPEGVCPLYYPVKTPKKAAILPRLLQRGIEAINVWSEPSPAVPTGTFPEVDELRATILELPCHQDLTLKEMQSIANEMRACL